MKKKILVGITSAMLVASVGFAAPITDLTKGETNVGYNYSNLDFKVSGEKIDSAGVNGLYLEHSLNDSAAVGIEYNSGDISKYGISLEDKETDVYGRYKIEKNASLIMGMRSYDQSLKVDGIEDTSYNSNKLLYGIGFNGKLGTNLNGYAAILATNIETEYRLGTTYQINDQANFDINYKSKDFDDSDAKLQGFGFGLFYKF
jgi:opacity protein-like surface antigen